MTPEHPKDTGADGLQPAVRRRAGLCRRASDGLERHSALGARCRGAIHGRRVGDVCPRRPGNKRSTGCRRPVAISDGRRASRSPSSLPVSTGIQHGSAFEGILYEAKAIGADLIVMGTHGRSGLSHMMLGSVAERVIRGAHCPVLAVRTLPGHRKTRVLRSPAPLDEAVADRGGMGTTRSGVRARGWSHVGRSPRRDAEISQCC